MRKGFTLLELLLAMSLLALLMALAYGGVVEFLKWRSDLDALASAQAKLRRIVEVFTQDLRSAVFGGLSGSPYPTGETSLSFALIEGGAGYPVLPHDAGPNQSFERASEVKILAPVGNASELGIAQGDTVLMVNNAGDGVLLPVTNVSPVSGEPGRWHIVHAGCGNTITYTPNTLLFRVRTLGLRYNPETKVLEAGVGTGSPVPLAFDLSRFRVDYIYEATRGDVLVNPSLPPGQTPPNEVSHNNRTYTLRRLQLVLETGFPSRGRMLSRSYTAQVELSSNTQYDVKQILPCR
ncbi:prepilin-like protein [Thermus scotoductus]|uniref:Prepilin-like protein n=1 Tax=Thermus scotoductus TaxID=37636 RepID=A0A430S676_THESC|nr:prepilin-type N-terminal cleavage/methylation domain-containing protein [Thermus scotoductus]RTG96196.1 prepilin-like protein [Thermus scotoductus]RTH05721.1 prepilin-like protein [Thermus scotoductus]RTH10511.1 prepilin-like protein [Thermus scotoductus]RTH11715.1 prepilin-like protein [Thermus scotoductus]RTH18437.1 prepilin-like protein [Thermus scotoductus]